MIYLLLILATFAPSQTVAATMEPKIMDWLPILFSIALAAGAYILGYERGYRSGIGINYAEVSKQARTWLQEAGELLRRKWSDCE